MFPGRDVAGGPGNMVIGRSGTYGILDGDEWTTYPLGLIERAYIVSQADKLQVVVLTEKSAVSALALLTILEDGTVVSEMISDREPLGVGGSPEPFVDPAAAIGPDGTIAATFDGSAIWLKHPDVPFEPQPFPCHFEFSGEGSGRIYSEDGELDCSESCTLDSHVGARFFVKTESEPGTELRLELVSPNAPTLFGGCWATVRRGATTNSPDLDGDASKSHRIQARFTAACRSVTDEIMWRLRPSFGMKWWRSDWRSMPVMVTFPSVRLFLRRRILSSSEVLLSTIARVEQASRGSFRPRPRTSRFAQMGACSSR